MLIIAPEGKKKILTHFQSVEMLLNGWMKFRVLCLFSLSSWPQSTGNKQISGTHEVGISKVFNLVKRRPCWCNINSDLRWNRRPMSSVKFPVQIVRGVILEKLAEMWIPEKKNIWETSKLRPCKGSRIANHAWANNTSLILKTVQLLTKALSEPEKH